MFSKKHGLRPCAIAFAVALALGLTGCGGGGGGSNVRPTPPPSGGSGGGSGGSGGGSGGSGGGSSFTGGEVSVDAGQTTTWSDNLDGSIDLVKVGAGTLVLAGTNTYSGGTTVSAGTLQLGAGGTHGSIIGDVTDNAVLAFDRSDDVTFGGAISGSGSLRQLGTGTLILTGTNSYSGGTTISNGTLQLGNGGTTGWITGDVTDNGVLVFDRSDDVSFGSAANSVVYYSPTASGGSSFGGVISGSGSLVQSGTGTLTLTGDNTYTGATKVLAGGLYVDGDQSAATGATTVADGAVLGGKGTIGGDVSLADGATLAPGSRDAVGTLTINGNLALSSGSILDYTLGQADIVGGSLNDLTEVGGNLVLDGTLNVSVADGGSFGPGTYRLFDYAGTLTDNGLALGSLPSSSVHIETSVAHQVNLIDTQGQTFSFWDGDAGPKDNNAVDGGSGTWESGGTTNDWTDAGGATNGTFGDGSFAIFQATPGTVTVDASHGAINVAGLQFASDGYVIQGDAIHLVGSTDNPETSIIRVGDGTNAGAHYQATIGSTLTGTSALVKTDYGILRLTGTNTYSGGTTISGGVLVVGDGGTHGSITGNVTDNGELSFYRSDAIGFAGNVSGSGSLEQGGSGSTTLTGNNTYGGDTYIDDGALIIGNGGTAGRIAGDVFNDGVLTFDHSDNVSFSGRISGSGSLIQAGNGALTLTGANTYMGATEVQAGGLYVDGDQSAATGTTSVASGAVLGGKGTIGGDVTLADGATLAPGSLGAVGTLTIDGNLALSSGSILDYALGQADTVGGSLNDLADVNGNLTLDGTLNVSVSQGGYFGPGSYRLFDFAGTLTDNGLTLGSMPVSGAQVQTAVPHQVNLVVSQPNLNMGFWDGDAGPKDNGAVDGGNGTWQRGGPLNWTDAGGAINKSFDDGSFAVFQGTPGTVTVSDGNGDINVAGMQFASSGYTVKGDSINLTGSSDDPAHSIIRVGDGTAAGSGYTATVESVLAGDSALVKTDLGTLILEGDNSYSGGTSITGGILQVGNGGATGNITGDVTDNGSLIFDDSDTVVFDGAISGNGALMNAGAGTLVLTGDSTYRGGTSTSGYLQIGQGGTTGSIIGDVIDNGGLIFARSDDLTFGGVISGDGLLLQAGRGALTLTGANSYSGETDVIGGLYVNGDQSAATGPTYVDKGAALGGNGTIGGDVTLFGGATLSPGSQGAIGALTIDGDLILYSGSILDYTLGQAGTVGGILNDLVNVNGNLVLDGTLDVGVAAGGSFGPGTYRLINYTGTLTDNGLELGDLPSATVQLQTWVPQQINLVVSTPNSDISFWDGSAGPKNNNAVDGGSGTWEIGSAITSNNWTDAAGAMNTAFTDGSFAVFQSAPGTVAVSTGNGEINVAGMQFASDGYVLKGDSINLIGGADDPARTIIRVGDGTNAGADYTATINSVLTGTSTLLKTDFGTLVLSGDNRYSGGTLINSGILQIGDGGATGGVIGNITNNGSLVFDRANTLNFSGIITGNGSLTQSGAGTLILSGDSTYTGGTTVDAGTLQLGDGGTTGDVTGDVTNNGVLVFDRSDDITFNGSINGSGSLIQAGTGVLTLTSGTNFYTGGTTINSGALVVDVANGDGIRGDIFDNGSLIFDTSGINGSGLGFGGVISGNGSLTKAGSGTLYLYADETYTGGTEISGGTLVIGDPYSNSAAGSIVGNVTDNGVLAFGRADDTTFAGDISGAGSVSVLGRGVVTLTGDNTFTGGVEVGAGALQLGDGGTSGSIVGGVNIEAGSLTFNRSDNFTYEGGLSGSGTVVKEGGGTLTLGGAIGSSIVLEARAGEVILLPGVTLGKALSVSSATAIVSAGGSVNGVGMGMGGILENSGTIATDSTAAVYGSGAEGVTGVINHAGGIIQVMNPTGDNSESAISLGPESVVTNEKDATISGYVGVSAATVNNQGGNIIGADRDGISGAIVVNNSDGGSIIGGQNGGVVGQLSAGVYTLSTNAVVSNIGGSYIAGVRVGVDLRHSGSVTNDSNSTISGKEGISITDSSPASDSVINEGGSIITGDTVGIYLNFGGSIFNGAGSTIEATASPSVDCSVTLACSIYVPAYTAYGSYGSNGALNLTNAGYIVGNVQMDSGAANVVTLTAGGSIAGNLDIGTNASSTLTLNGGSGTSQLYSNAVTGTTTFGGTLIKEGNGTWTIDVDGQLLATDTTVNGGTLKATGVLSGNAEVMAGGTLDGVPGVAANLSNSGRVTAHGGVSSVGGDYVQSSTGTLAVSLGSKLAVTGTATLNGGTLEVTGADSGYVSNTHTDVLTAGGGVSGTFDQLVKDSGVVFTSSTIHYDANGVWLDTTGLNVTTAAAGDGVSYTPASMGSAQRVQGAFEQLDSKIVAGNASEVSGQFLSAAGQFQQAPTLQAAQASLTSLSGQLHAASAAMTFEAIDASSRALSDHFDSLLAKGVSRGMWMQNLSMGGDMARAGFDGVGFQLNGWLAGSERPVGRSGVAGFAFGQSQGQQRLAGGFDHDTSHNTEGMLYAGWIDGSWYTQGRVGFGHVQQDVSRQVLLGESAEGVETRYNGGYSVAYGESGLHFGRGDSHVTPFVDVDYARIRRDGFAERGAGGFGLRSDAQNLDRWQAGVGVRAGPNRGLGGGRAVDLNARAQWQRTLASSGDVFQASFVGLQQWQPLTGIGLSRYSGQFGLDLDATLSAHTALTFGYDYETGQRDRAQTVSMRLNMAF